VGGLDGTHQAKGAVPRISLISLGQPVVKVLRSRPISRHGHFRDPMKAEAVFRSYPASEQQMEPTC